MLTVWISRESVTIAVLLLHLMHPNTMHTEPTELFTLTICIGSSHLTHRNFIGYLLKLRLLMPFSTACLYSQNRYCYFYPLLLIPILQSASQPLSSFSSLFLSFLKGSFSLKFSKLAWMSFFFKLAEVSLLVEGIITMR